MTERRADALRLDSASPRGEAASEGVVCSLCDLKKHVGKPTVLLLLQATANCIVNGLESTTDTWKGH